MLVNKYFEDEFWDDLSPKAQDVANKVYEFMIKMKESTEPVGATISKEQWEILVYNAALIAAWAVDNDLPEHIIDDDLITPLNLN